MPTWYYFPLWYHPHSMSIGRDRDGNPCTGSVACRAELPAGHELFRDDLMQKVFFPIDFAYPLSVQVLRVEGQGDAATVCSRGTQLMFALSPVETFSEYRPGQKPWYSTLSFIFGLLAVCLCCPVLCLCFCLRSGDKRRLRNNPSTIWEDSRSCQDGNAWNGKALTNLAEPRPLENKVGHAMEDLDQVQVEVVDSANKSKDHSNTATSSGCLGGGVCNFLRYT